MVLKVKGFISSNYGLLDCSVSPYTRTEEKILKDYSFLNVQSVYQSYRRYGYVLSNLVSQKFLFSWLKDYRLSSIFNRFRSTMFNSGMGAIATVLDALSTKENYVIIIPQDLYFCSQTLIKNLSKKFKKVITAKDPSVKSLNELCINNKDEKLILFLESVSNSPKMFYFSEEDIKNLSRKVDYLLLDNTLFGAPQTNPSFLKQGNIVYIESLSKNYHRSNSSLISSGICIYPKEMLPMINEAMSSMGTYLQINDLLEMPLHMYYIGKMNISQISKNTKRLYNTIKNLNKEKQLASVPELNLNKKFPCVLFLDFKKREPAKRFIRYMGLEERGSFGHKKSTVFAIGFKWKNVSPGLIRISPGYGDKRLGRKIKNFPLRNILHPKTI